MRGLNAAPVRIMDEETGEWIAIKPKLSRGDVDWLTNQLLVYRLEQDRTIGEVKALNRETLLLQRAIVGWHLLDEEGKEFPFKPENIALLPVDSELVDRVLAEIAERNPTLSSANSPSGVGMASG